MDTVDPRTPTTRELLAQVEQLRARLNALESAPAAQASSGPPLTSTRRHAFRLAGAATAAAIVGSASTPRPAAASDPNDVVKNITNFATGTTELFGSVSGSMLQVQNFASGPGDGGLRGICSSPSTAAVAGLNTREGVGVSATALTGVDLAASGSGRISLRSHAFNSNENYSAGEFHQSDGTLFAMVTPTTRRVVAGPATAGALHLIDPVRVYDSRRPAPSPGKLTAGASEVISVADGRNLSTGSTVAPNVVPVNATGIAFNLTVTETSASGFLSITRGTATAANASIINWSTAGATLANASIVAVDNNRRVRVFCGAGSTHLILDVVGYHL